MRIIGTPSNYEAVYTDSMSWVVESPTFSSSENYKYIFDLYNNNGIVQDQFLARVAPYPRPNGTGLYSPHEVLQNIIRTPLDPFVVNGAIQTYTSRALYSIQLSEQYNPGLTFSDTFFTSSVVGLTFSSNINNQIFTGDILTFTMPNVSVNLQTGMTATVTSVPFNNFVVTDRPWQADTTNEFGNIVNIFRAGPKSPQLVAWNAVRGDDRIKRNYFVQDTNPFDSYVQGSTYSKFLTVKENSKVTLNDWETIDLLVATSSYIGTFSKLYLEFKYYNNNNSLIATELNSQTTTNEFLRAQFGVGPKNFLPIGLSFSQQIKYYTIQTGISAFTGVTPSNYISQVKRYDIQCDETAWSNVRVIFLNDLGGYDYLNCNLKNQKTYNINRVEIDAAINPTPVADLTNWAPNQRGATHIWGKYNTIWTVNTNILTDAEALEVKRLVMSNNVWILDGLTLIPVVVDESSWVLKTGVNDGIVQYTIKLRFSRSNKINK